MEEWRRREVERGSFITLRNSPVIRHNWATPTATHHHHHHQERASTTSSSSWPGHRAQTSGDAEGSQPATPPPPPASQVAEAQVRACVQDMKVNNTE
ncbi:hypothetical protein O3P69_013529 [Scylla paramamosain]|uniref:Uncharacterized protein n=1 Tax=Scylla paramamosain TaxID=85552 RepID=A0AAW0SE98_SCYPA